MAKTYEEKLQGIVERIENSNGTAIKFADGTMICAKFVAFHGVAAKTLGNIYATDELDMRKLC